MFDEELNPQVINHVVLIFLFISIFSDILQNQMCLEPCQTSKMELKTVIYFGNETPL